MILNSCFSANFSDFILHIHEAWLPGMFTSFLYTVNPDENSCKPALFFYPSLNVHIYPNTKSNLTCLCILNIFLSCFLSAYPPMYVIALSFKQIYNFLEYLSFLPLLRSSLWHLSPCLSSCHIKSSLCFILYPSWLCI